MNIKTLSISVILAFALAPAGFAQDESVSGEVSRNCPNPEKPTIPDGKNSSEDEMITAQGHMKTYVAEGNAYLECLANLEKSWGKGASDSKKQLVVILHNKMVDDMNHVADMFNSAVRAFKGKK